MGALLAAADPKLTWYASRASGLLTWVLCAAGILCGLLFSTRLVRRRGFPPWLLDLHSFLGTLALVFSGVHLAALALDNYVRFGWSDLFVPMASPWRPGAVAWGIVAWYLLVAVQLTSWMRRRLPRRLWHALHLGSLPLFAAGTIHGVMAGTEAAERMVLAGGGVVVVLVVIAVVVRVRARALPPSPAPSPTLHEKRREGPVLVQSSPEPAGENPPPEPPLDPERLIAEILSREMLGQSGGRAVHTSNPAR